MGGFDCMENTPTGCADDLPSILAIFKNDPKSRSVNNSLQRPDLDPGSINDFFYQPKLRPVCVFVTFVAWIAFMLKLWCFEIPDCCSLENQGFSVFVFLSI